MPDICLITEGLTSFEQKGGVSTWISELIGSLPEYQFSWVNFSSSQAIHSSKLFFRNLVFSKSILINSYPLDMDSIKKQIEKELFPRCAIYHPTSTGCASLLGMFLSDRDQAPLILTEHAIYWKEIQDNHELECGIALPKEYGAKFREIAQITYQKAQMITSPVRYIRDLQIEEGANSEICHIIPNGLTPLVETRKIINRPFCIGFVGRITRIKNLEQWIQIAGEIHFLLPEIQFKIIGPVNDVYYSDMLHKQIKELCLDKCLFILPAMNHQNWREEIDVLLVTSHMESQPYIILEAFSSGIPVFARSVGGIQETISSCGCLFAEDETPRKIAELISNQVKDSAILEEYRRSGLLFFQSRYHVSHMKNEFIKLYKQGLHLNA